MTKFQMGMAAAAAAVLAFGVAACGQTTAVEEPAAVEEATPEATPEAVPPVDGAAPAEGAAPADGATPAPATP